MKTEPSPYNDSESLIVEFLKSFLAADNPAGVLSDFTKRFPQHAEEFRELAQLNKALEGEKKPVPPPPPDRLGEFRIVRMINHGGMGEIYEAYHERLDRRVALKIIRRGWSSDDARERFIREQHVLANLHHSHIVPIHSSGEEGSIQYFTMPYINGASLNYVVSTVASLNSPSSSKKTPRLSEIIGQVVNQSDDFGSRSTVLHKDSISNLSNDERPNLPAGLKLSREYFVSVAKTMADVAEAVEYAHKAGVLHRDLKPANVMVEPNGHSWVIDFGLAAARNRNAKSKKGTTPDIKATDPSDLNLTQGRGGGTLNYMAPERWEGLPADKLSDIFSLGAMLYELLTLRRAFNGSSPEEIGSNIRTAYPLAAHKLVSPLPVDIEAIANKAMHKTPALRYQTAGAMAEDLQRWMRGEPTIARRPWLPRRLWMWAARKPSVAAAVLVSLFALIATGVTIADSYKSRAIAQLQANEARREAMMKDSLQERRNGHRANWSDENWDIIRRIADLGKSDELRDVAAASLAGLDARILKNLTIEPNEIVYNSSGTQLLMSKVVQNDPNNSSSDHEEVHIWDSVTDEIRVLPQQHHDAFGPVTYRNDGTPIQLVWDKSDSNAVVLWDMVNQKAFRRLEVPIQIPESPKAWSMTVEGKFVGVLVDEPDAIDSKRTIFVWETESGNLVLKQPTTARDLELSPDGSLISTSVENGIVEVWSVARKEQIAKLTSGRSAILCMAWSKDYLHKVNDKENGWLLAVGSTGGDLTIWDINSPVPRSFCRGSAYDVHRVAFSTDGMTLASVGRESPMLWDVASGQLLLRLSARNVMSLLAYSPDGKSLAIGFEPIFAPSGGVDVYKIEDVRGQQVLRGLQAPVSQVCFSSNNRYLCALAQNWQLGVWDLESHRLLQVFETPMGLFAQSAGLAIDADGRRVAVVAGTEARVWDVATGSEEKSLTLNKGFLDCLVFHGKDELLLIRQESVDPQFPPIGPNQYPEKTPRVCRVRNLLGKEPLQPLFEIPDFKMSAVAIKTNGHGVVIEGYDVAGREPERIIKYFELPTGTERWAQRSKFVQDSHRVSLLDPSGRFLAMSDETFNEPTLIDFDSGQLVRSTKLSLIGLGPGAKINVAGTNNPDTPNRQKRVLVRGDNNDVLFTLGEAYATSTGLDIFSSDGRYVASGNIDGTVTVCDIERVRSKLAELGMGWKSE